MPDVVRLGEVDVEYGGYTGTVTCKIQSFAGDEPFYSVGANFECDDGSGTVGRSAAADVWRKEPPSILRHHILGRERRRERRGLAPVVETVLSATFNQIDRLNEARGAVPRRVGKTPESVAERIVDELDYDEPSGVGVDVRA